jgi:hypothetical protein
MIILQPILQPYPSAYPSAISFSHDYPSAISFSLSFSHDYPSATNEIAPGERRVYKPPDERIKSGC